MGHLILKAKNIKDIMDAVKKLSKYELKTYRKRTEIKVVVFVQRPQVKCIVSKLLGGQRQWHVKTILLGYNKSQAAFCLYLFENAVGCPHRPETRVGKPSFAKGLFIEAWDYQYIS